MIDEDRTMQLYGYYSYDLKLKSAKPIVKVCDGCGTYSISPKYRYRDLCKSCSKKGKSNPHKLPKPKFVEEENRFIPETGIDRIATINQFGYDPVDSKPKSGLPIVKFCSDCGKKIVITKNIYRDLCKSCSQIGKKQSEETRIIQSCIQQGINREDFIGFISKQKYCEKFNESLKQQIRNQYSNCDYISGIHKDVCNPNCELSVHHVNYDKNCGCDGNRCKLIPLCISNHSKTNKNRSFWNRLFIYSLEYDKEYYNEVI